MILNREQAREILKSVTCCCECDDNDVIFLLHVIKEGFPDLWTEYAFPRTVK